MDFGRIVRRPVGLGLGRLRGEGCASHSCGTVEDGIAGNAVEVGLPTEHAAVGRLIP